MNQPPSPEERVWAVLAHLSALAFGMGLLLPVIGWAEQRRKSKYIAYQCLQALGYQSLGYTFWFLGYLLFIVLLILVLMIVAIVGAGNEDLFVASIIGFDVFLVIFIFMAFGIYFLFPIIAAIACGMGKDFRYPFMGNRLARYLGYDLENENLLNEEHEDRWVAAMGHFSVIIAFWGMLAPVTAWILQGKRSAWLKFQSAQAVAFHVCVLLFGFAAGALYFFGAFVFIILTGFSGDARMSSPAGILGVVIMFGSMAVALLMALVIPLFHIMGQWAGYRVLKGDDYKYPIVGKLVARVIPSDAESAAKNLPAGEEDPSRSLS